MNRCRGALAVFVALAAVVGPCMGCARGDVVTAPATLPTTSAPRGELSSADEEAIRTALERSSDFAASFDDRLPYLLDADDLRDVAERVAELARSYAATVEVGKVVGNAPAPDQTVDVATAYVDVTVGETKLLDDGPIDVRRVDGRWLVTRAGACTIIALVAPCPAASG